MAFLGFNANIMDSTLADGVICDNQSCVFPSLVRDGLIQHLILAKLHAEAMNVNRAIVINCTAKKIVAEKGCILYNTLDDCDDMIVAKVDDVTVSVLDERVLVRY